MWLWCGVFLSWRESEESYMLEKFQITIRKENCGRDLNVLEKLRRPVFISGSRGELVNGCSMFRKCGSAVDDEIIVQQIFMKTSQMSFVPSWYSLHTQVESPQCFKQVDILHHTCIFLDFWWILSEVLHEFSMSTFPIQCWFSFYLPQRQLWICDLCLHMWCVCCCRK